MIDRLNGRTALLVAAAALLVVVLVGWFGFLAPQRAKANELQGEIRRTELQLHATEALISGSALKESAEELARFRTAIPDDVGMPDILRQLSAASAEAGISISAITPAAPVANGVADAIPITLTAQGRYFALREFLHRLRTRAALEGDELRATGRLFSVESIQFSGGQGAGGLVQASLTLSAYTFRAPAETPATAPPPVDAAAEAAGG